VGPAEHGHADLVARDRVIDHLLIALVDSTTTSPKDAGDRYPNGAAAKPGAARPSGLRGA
jgi:hypothetical protein